MLRRPPRSTPLSLHDALPICCHFRDLAAEFAAAGAQRVGISRDSVDKQHQFSEKHGFDYPLLSDANRSESTRLNSSHMSISYAVFCLKKKKKKKKTTTK